MPIEVGSAVVAVIPSTRGFGKELSRQLAPEMASVGKDITKSLGDEMTKTAAAEGKKVGSAWSKPMAKAMKVDLDKTMTNMLKGIGAVGAGVLGTALFKGFGRLKDIDNATAKLDGLGHSGESVKKIMDNALAAVKGTAFGLGEAASVAATITATGVKEGADLERILKLVGDAATIGGSSLTEMGGIWAKVAATGKLSGREMFQLNAQGIPVLQMLASHYGITAAAANDMVTKGKVSFDDFATAMEKKLGGAAAKSGETFEGALANVGAALGRLGASLLGVSFKDLTTTFGELSDKLDQLGPAAKVFGDALAGVAGWAKDSSGWLLPLVSGFVAMAAAYKAATLAAAAHALIIAIVNAGSISAMFGVLGLNASLLAFPGTWIVLAIAAIGAALFALWKTNDGFRDGVIGAWNAVKDAATATWSWVSEKAVAAWDAITGAWGNVGEFFTGMWGGLTSGATDAWAGVTSSTTAAWDGIKTFISDTAESIRDTLTTVFSAVADFVKQQWDLVWTGAKLVWDYVGWPIFVAIRAVVLLVAWGFEIMAERIVGAWNFWVNVAKTVWENVLSPVFEGIKTGAGWLADKFVWLKDRTIEAWDALVAGVKRAYDTVIVPLNAAFTAVMEALAVLGNWLRDSIVAAWDFLVAGVKRAYDTVIVPLNAAFTAVMEALAALGNWLRDQIVAAWDAFAAGMRAVYDKIIVPLWEAFKAAVAVLAAAFVTAKDKLSAAWQAVVDKLQEGWNWIRDRVFDPLGKAVAAIPGFFERAKSEIEKLWNKIKEIVAEPIRFVVNTVIRDGIVEAWNKVADKLQLPNWKFDGVSFATGGWTGPGSKYQPAGVVHADEYVIRKESQQSLSKSYPGLLDYLNRHGAMPGYAGGGQVWANMWAWARNNLPGMQLTSGYRPGSNDYHGAGKAIDVAAGMDGAGKSAMLRAAGIIYNTFGPSILELIHAPLGPGKQLKRGKPIDYGAATLAQHYNHVHWAMESFDGNATAADFVGGTFDDPAGAALKSLLTAPFAIAEAGIKKLFDKEDKSAWDDIAIGFAKKPLADVRDFLDKTINLLFPPITWDEGTFGGETGAKAKAWGDTIAQALQILGQPASLQGIVAKRLNQESGGRQDAVNRTDCVTLGSMALTHRGWLTHDQVRVGDTTTGYNPDTRRSEQTPITRVVHYDDAPLVTLTAGDWTATTTPNHRWLTTDDYGSTAWTTTADLTEADRVLIDGDTAAVVTGITKTDAGVGPVWCVTTGNGSWTAKSEHEDVFLTGNSNAQRGDPSKGLMQVIGCVPLDTMILTKRGWLAHDQVVEGDETIGFDHATGKSRWTTVTGVVHYDDAEVWRIGNRQWSADVTPDHRWVTEVDRDLIDAALECPVCGKTWATRRGMETHLGKAHNLKQATRRETSTGFAKTRDLAWEYLRVSAPANTPVTVPITDREAALIGWIQGDGHLREAFGTTGLHRGWDANLYQSKPIGVESIRGLLVDVPHTETARKPRASDSWPAYQWALRRAYVTELLARARFDVDDPSGFVLSLSTTQRAAWLQAMIEAEGHTRDGFTRITQVDGPVQDAITLAVYLSGSRPTFSALAAERNGYQPSGNVGMARPRVAASMLDDHTVLDRQPVWCVETELGSWTMRQGRRVTLTGNSTFKEYAMPGFVKDIFDPMSNILASLRYAISRYGSISNAFNRPGGYALGGLVQPTLYDRGGYLPPGLTLAANLTGRPEKVLTAEQEQGYTSRQTYIINTVDRDRVEDLVREIEHATRVSTLTRRYR